jgi:rare lipoprotein A
VRLHRQGASPGPLLILVVLSLLHSLSCATGRRAQDGQVGFTERGLASWYGPGFHGRATASGETYDMYDHTAAHKSLPLGTVVEVRNRDNGKRTKVRINDRGPFVRGRVIDLSYSAAEDLDMLGPGTAPIELRVLQTAELATQPGGFWLQVAAFQEKSHAKELRNELHSSQPKVQVQSQGGWHRVLVGPFKNRKQAEQAERQLRKLGYYPVLKTGA